LHAEEVVVRYGIHELPELLGPRRLGTRLAARSRLDVAQRERHAHLCSRHQLVHGVYCHAMCALYQLDARLRARRDEHGCLVNAKHGSILGHLRLVLGSHGFDVHADL
jgi:hypothetical protein